MAVQLGLDELTGRAAMRAVPPKRWARLASESVSRQGLDAESAAHAVSAALLRQLVRPGSPALLTSYVTQALASGLVTARAFALALLAHLHRDPDTVPPIPTPLLSTLASALLAHPTGLDDLLPSPVMLPGDAPDIGTSASAAAATTAEEVPALALLLPFLRQCAAAPAPAPLLVLAARLAVLIPPLPAPPFDAGLEAAQLSSMLPEDVAKPLRESLAGLMADLPLPDAAPQADVAMFGSALPDVATGFTDPSNGMQLGQLGGPSALPLQHAASFLIEYANHAHSWTQNTGYATNPPSPPPHHMHIIRLGRALTGDSQAFLVALLEAAVGRVLASWANGPNAAVKPFVFFTDELPVLLRWWRDHADSKWPFPPNLSGALGDVFASHTAQLSTWYEAVNSLYTAKFSQSEADESTDSYMQPEGWSLFTLELTSVRRYVSLGLLDDEGATAITGGPVKASPPGESLLERLANASPAHLPALELFIAFASGAPHALGAEVVSCIMSATQMPPPEDLFVRLASSPALMVVVAAYITPSTLLDLAVTQLLDHVEDESARSADPQGSLIRFGCGVVFIEGLCAQFKLPLPDLLYESRRAVNLADLGEQTRSHLNIWVKALFGPDGIDDQIILVTSSQTLCRLATTLVQQAIAAAAAGQIDLDTLHSGLSYFATPLLSWCLGGVVGWLCAEIERQGILSGLHLNVLQTLVLDSAFPDPLLRANARAITRLLESSSGLEPVLQSSNFDTVAVRTRLQAAGGPDGNPLVFDKHPIPCLYSLRAQLQAIRNLDLAPEGWEKRLLDTLDRTLRGYGPLPTLETAITDVLQPSLMGDGGDPLAQFIAILTALPLSRAYPLPMAITLVDSYVPMLFTPRSFFVPPPPPRPPSLIPIALPAIPEQPPPPLPFAAHALERLIRAAFFAADAYDPETGVVDVLAAHLADELAFQRARPDTAALRAPKRPAKGRGRGHWEQSTQSGLPPEQRELITELCAAFEADDELRARWPVLAGLQ